MTKHKLRGLKWKMMKLRGWVLHFSLKNKNKNLIECTKLLLLHGLGKVMINNFIYFKHTKQSNISFHKKFFFVKLDFSTVSDFKCFIIVSLGQKQWIRAPYKCIHTFSPYPIDTRKRVGFLYLWKKKFI